MCVCFFFHKGAPSDIKHNLSESLRDPEPSSNLIFSLSTKKGFHHADMALLWLPVAPPRSFDWGGADSGPSNPPTPKFRFPLEFRSLYFKNREKHKKAKLNPTCGGIFQPRTQCNSLQVSAR